MPFRLLLLAFAVMACLATATRADPSSSLFAEPGAKKIAGGFAHAEGPLWHPEGFLLFGDTGHDRLMRFEEPDALTVFRTPCGRATGLCFDAQGRLIAAETHGGEEGRRRLTRWNGKDEWLVLADRFEGRRFNSPNDLTVDRHGRVYFTDPRYSKRETMELDHESVFRLDSDGKLTRIIESLKRPNGILITPDGRTLYIADNAMVDGVAQLWAFDVNADGAVANARKIYDFGAGRGIDGMTLDETGRIWGAGGTKEKAGIYVFELDQKRHQARVQEFIPLPEDPTNCTFGGRDRDTLYITSGTSLYRIRTTVKGLPVPPGK